VETKTQKKLLDRSLGFPIRLVNVPMIKVRGKWTPKVNYNELALAVLHALAHKESRLSGNEIKFIRTHFEMNLQRFAKRFCVTHVGVMKWEKTEDRPTTMNWSTEKDIRLFVLSRLDAKAHEFASLYNELQELPEGKLHPIHLDAKKLAA
jgi:hypothetical protein